MTFSPQLGPKCNQLQLKINLLRKHFTSSLNHIHSPLPSAHTTYILHPVSSPYLNSCVINCTICSPYYRLSDCLGSLQIYPHQICVGVNGETLSAFKRKPKTAIKVWTTTRTDVCYYMVCPIFHLICMRVSQSSAVCIKDCITQVSEESLWS